MSPPFRYILAAQIHQHLQDINTFVLLLVEARNLKKYRYDLSQKPFVFGQDAPSVFHCYIQSPPVELHHGNAELKPEHWTLF